jgi:DNA-binding NarL/FixJ family response regulator
MIFTDERDTEILQFLKQGFAFKEVASRLDVGTRTIEKRLERMRFNNSCKTNLELMAKWVEEEKSALVFRFMHSMIDNSRQNGNG